MQEINLNLRSAGLPTPEKVFSWKGILSNDESYEMPVEIFILYHSGTMTFIIVLWKRRTTFWHVADYSYCKYTFSIITRKTNVWPNGLISFDLIAFDIIFAIPPKSAGLWVYITQSLVWSMRQYMNYTPLLLTLNTNIGDKGPW